MSATTHGGSRNGAGRKSGSGAYGEPTQPVRVPESQVETVVAWLDAYRKPSRASDPVPIAQSPSILALPAFAHTIAAGFPSPADDYLDDTIDLNQELVVQGHEAATFVLRVSGWSMVDAGLLDGDRIVVDRALDPRQGDIVVASINNDLTVKRLDRIDGRPALTPDNADFQPIVPAEDETLEIWGVVVSSMRTFKRRG